MLELGAGCGLSVVVFVDLDLDLDNGVVISTYHKGWLAIVKLKPLSLFISIF